MAWTNPKDWAVGEYVTAAMQNAHIRDNLKYLLPLTGRVNTDGTIAAGTGFTVSKTTGVYTITFSAAYAETPVVLVSLVAGGDEIIKTSGPSITGVIVTTATAGGVLTNTAFAFAVFPTH